MAEELTDQGPQPTDPADKAVLEELMQREPIFHRPEFGTTRQDFEQMLDPGFWEVGASGNRYSREFVLEGVLKRYADPNYRGIHSAPENTWKMTDFHCRKLASEIYQISYTLAQGERLTRRSTIWRRSDTGWRIVFHQGTIVQSR